MISVPDEFSLEELHDVLQLVFGSSGQAFYSFRIHGQEIGRRRHLRTQLLAAYGNGRVTNPLPLSAESSSRVLQIITAKVLVGLHLSIIEAAANFALNFFWF
jgi:hypothetical protein